jgi:hypothetical protein
MAEIRAISQEAHEYVVSANGNLAMPDPAKLSLFENRRRMAVEQGVQEVQRTLSSEGWKALSIYINKRHCQHVMSNALPIGEFKHQ